MKKKQLVEVVIKRSKWARKKADGTKNGYEGENYLRHGKGGNMCCLGFYLNQVHKISLKNLVGAARPSQLVGFDDDGWIGFDDDGWMQVAMNVNDRRDVYNDEIRDTRLTDKQQEREIAKLGKENGVLFKFVD